MTTATPHARIYIVTDPAGQRRLVRATSASAAIRYCTRAVYSATVARPADLTAALMAGAKVEDSLAAGNDA